MADGQTYAEAVKNTEQIINKWTKRRVNLGARFPNRLENLPTRKIRCAQQPVTP
jgi:predicted RNase H-like HicB family nuclease